MTGDRGFTVVEGLVALLLGLTVVHLGLEILARQRTVQTRLTRRVEALGALRLGRHLFREELRQGRHPTDWRPLDETSLVLRAFRGGGGVCPIRPAPEELLVAYRGLRRPDPAKDSVLLLGATGGWTARALTSAAATALGCPGARPLPLLRLGLSEEASSGVVYARIFESGSYHVAGGALRYRRGMGGRQPLTPEVLSSASGYASGPEALRLGLRTEGGGPLEAGWSGFLAWRTDGGP